jgi:acetyl-CoA carboxylase carboxyl transferase subunit beta
MGIIRLFTRQKPKIKVQLTKRDGFSGWIKCSGCEQTIHASELTQNCNCCPKCDYHYRMNVEDRINSLVDEGSFEELFAELESKDPLNFADKESYSEKLKEAQKKTGKKEAVVTGTGVIGSKKTAIGVLDFNFMGGSMGSIVGEKLTLLIEYATLNRLPVIIVSASGGARMQESMFSLMQMAKTSQALAKHHEEKLLFLSILTNPTMGGVTASFASLGDIILAEPKALIGFAGPRVVEQTIGHKLPEGAQKAEFLLEHGMIDAIVNRKEMKEKVAFILNFLDSNSLQNAKRRRVLTEKILEQIKIEAQKQEIEHANA